MPTQSLCWGSTEGPRCCAWIQFPWDHRALDPRTGQQPRTQARLSDLNHQLEWRNQLESGAEDSWIQLENMTAALPSTKMPVLRTGEDRGRRTPAGKEIKRRRQVKEIPWERNQTDYKKSEREHLICVLVSLRKEWLHFDSPVPFYLFYLLFQSGVPFFSCVIILFINTTRYSSMYYWFYWQEQT